MVEYYRREKGEEGQNERREVLSSGGGHVQMVEVVKKRIKERVRRGDREELGLRGWWKYSGEEGKWKRQRVKEEKDDSVELMWS